MADDGKSRPSIEILMGILTPLATLSVAGIVYFQTYNVQNSINRNTANVTNAQLEEDMRKALEQIKSAEKQQARQIESDDRKQDKDLQRAYNLTLLAELNKLRLADKQDRRERAIAINEEEIKRVETFSKLISDMADPKKARYALLAAATLYKGDKERLRVVALAALNTTDNDFLLYLGSISGEMSEAISNVKKSTTDPIIKQSATVALGGYKVPLASLLEHELNLALKGGDKAKRIEARVREYSSDAEANKYFAGVMSNIDSPVAPWLVRNKFVRSENVGEKNKLAGMFAKFFSSSSPDVLMNARDALASGIQPMTPTLGNMILNVCIDKLKNEQISFDQRIYPYLLQVLHDLSIEFKPNPIIEGWLPDVTPSSLWSIPGNLVDPYVKGGERSGEPFEGHLKSPGVSLNGNYEEIMLDDPFRDVDDSSDFYAHRTGTKAGWGDYVDHMVYVPHYWMSWASEDGSSNKARSRRFIMPPIQIDGGGMVPQVQNINEMPERKALLKLDEKAAKILAEHDYSYGTRCGIAKEGLNSLMDIAHLLCGMYVDNSHVLPPGTILPDDFCLYLIRTVYKYSPKRGLSLFSEFLAKCSLKKEKGSYFLFKEQKVATLESVQRFLERVDTGVYLKKYKMPREAKPHLWSEWRKRNSEFLAKSRED